MAEFKPGVNPLFLREEALREGMDMLFIAWRDSTAASDRVLQEHGLGRAHQRALYFIARRPGLTVGDLLAVLGVTKQSLSRVLRALVEAGLVDQSPGRIDRRQKQLTLTEEGRRLEDRCTAPQRARFAKAYREAGAEAVEGFRTVLRGLRVGPA
jgi:DNA-binding MarR family transcriptional regulator